MATGQRANRPGRGTSDDEAPPDEVPEGTDPGVAPVGGTVVTEEPADEVEDEPVRPQRRQASRAPAPPPRRQRPAPANEELEEPPAEDPRATRILSVESIDAPVKYELLVTAGPARGGRFPLHNGTLTIGRSAQCDCSILDEAISRRHFELQVDGHGVLLRDLGSGNGTLVNGERADEVTLSHGDILNIGDSTLELRERGRAPISATAHGKGRATTAARMPVARGAPRGKGAQNRRTVLIGALAVATLFIVMVGLAKMKAKQQAIAAATAAFERGRQELEQGNADDALDDFQRAIVAYPDPNIIQEKAAIAHVISDGNKALTHARDLIDQKDFSAATKVLDGVPHNDYLDAQVKAVRDDIQKRQAEIEAALHAMRANGAPIDPTTLAEAREHWERAKKEPADAAEADAALAYNMLASKGAGGDEFDQLKLFYVETLKKIYDKYRHSSLSKATMAQNTANQIIPDSIPEGGHAASKPSETPVKQTVKHTHHVTHTPVHHHQAVSSSSHRDNASPPPAAGGEAGGGHYDDARAEDLDDQGDALLGQNPDGAKDKYRQALHYAAPGSDAASRARAGLGN